MIIQSARLDNRKRAFVLQSERGVFPFPYAKCDPPPTPEDRVTEFWIDDELAREGLTYRLASGREGVVLVDMALDYNREPRYMRDLLLYRLTLDAQKALDASGLSKREVMRRLGTSASQLYRLLDQTDYSKSVDKMLELLSVLGCDVEMTVRQRSA